MTTYKSLQQRVLTLNQNDFTALALEIFEYQSSNNLLYKSYLEYLGVQTSNVKRVEDIPFLPISFFKKHEIKSGEWANETVFESSGTTGALTSKHYVRDSQYYLSIARGIFKKFYGAHTNYHFLFLLPSYLERNGSSLVYMAEDFAAAACSEHSGFYLSDYDQLIFTLKTLKNKGDRKVILWGVTFALLELAENYDLSLQDCLIMETGGMKGRRKELTRAELHDVLKGSFSCQNIHSEYGMTELFSQSYSLSEGYFSLPNSMKIILRDPNDPFDIGGHRKAGGINVIDLANIHSCSFIETEDLGRVEPNRGFQVLGRFDNSDIRGCNLMM